MIVKRLTFFATMIKQAVQEFLTDNCTHLAAAISYYLLLSLFPLALAAISILSFVSRSPNVEARVIDGITAVLPLSGDLVSAAIKDFSPGAGVAGAIATIGLLWSGTGVFNAMRKSLNTAWGIKTPRPFLRERLIELVMMVGFGLFLLVYVGMTTAFTVIRSSSPSIFGGRFAEGGLFWHAMVIIASIAIGFVGFLFLYKFVPNTRVRWKNIWIGALMAAIMFEIVKNAFVWFVGEFATYNLVYGAIGTVIALMTWTFISSVILLFCAKLISIYPRMKSSLLAEVPVEKESAEKTDSEPPVSKFIVRSKTATGKKT
jgi:membrane protein